MTTIAPSDPVTQIAETLLLIKQARHWEGCACFLYRTEDRQGFCSLDEAECNRALNILLDNILAMR